jgi:anti-sigma-K factor RskA
LSLENILIDYAKMNVQELISSGKLELYVAGALSDGEMREIATAAQQNPELETEIRKIESTLVQFYAAEVESMNKEEMDKNLKEIFYSGSKESIVRDIKVDRKDKKQFSISKLAVAAMTAGILLTSALSVLMFVQNNNLRNEVAGIRQQQQDLVSQNETLRKESEILQTRFELVRNILTERVELTAIPGKASNDNYILVYWNPKTKQVMMADANLPELPPDQQYQLWALLDNNVQVDCGVFDIRRGQSPASFMKNADQAKGFAVTVEPHGGSRTPTLGNLRVMANL